MLCPDCRNGILIVQYMTGPGPMILDGPDCPPRQIPTALVCPHCGNGHFILHGESASEAYDRIAPDITRAMYRAQRKRPDCQ